MPTLKLINNEHLNNVHGCYGNKSLINLQFKHSKNSFLALISQSFFK